MQAAPGFARLLQRPPEQDLSGIALLANDAASRAAKSSETKDAITSIANEDIYEPAKPVSTALARKRRRILGRSRRF
jgi:hypothetical protein